MKPRQIDAILRQCIRDTPADHPDKAELERIADSPDPVLKKRGRPFGTKKADTIASKVLAFRVDEKLADRFTDKVPSNQRREWLEARITEHLSGAD